MTRRLRSGSRKPALDAVDPWRQIGWQRQITESIGQLLFDILGSGIDRALQELHEVQVFPLECKGIPFGPRPARNHFLQGASNLGNRGPGIRRPFRQVLL